MISQRELDALASGKEFSGVVRIDQDDRIELARAYGLAHRGFEIPNAVDTRFGLASGAKGFTSQTGGFLSDGRNAGKRGCEAPRSDGKERLGWSACRACRVDDR